jgi:hypothetical protein
LFRIPRRLPAKVIHLLCELRQALIQRACVHDKLTQAILLHMHMSTARI